MTKIDIDASNLKKDEKIVYEYDSYGRVKSVKRVSKDDCWVVTAYYGEPMHPNVMEIRSMRESLVENSILGLPVRAISWLYYSLGRSRLGAWWRSGLGSTKENFFRAVTRPVCNILLMIARYNNRARMRRAGA